jgi:Asp-tRNA(Asn)/Glu-tRNA(Gln) amidotransferase A subunit family amidase
LKTIVAAGVAGSAGATLAQPSADEAITGADLAAADRLAGRTHTEAERALMARRAGRTRDSLRAVRAFPLTERDAPALEFDPRLPGTPTPTGTSESRMSGGPLPAYSGQPETLAFAPVVDLARLVQARKVTATDLTRMYLDRLKRLGPRLNCVVTLTEPLALDQAARADQEIAAGRYRGPLHGIPWGAKDLLATKGIRTTWGAKPFENQVFDHDATVVRRLEDAGAVLVAKLALGELAQGDRWFGGLTRNPWKPDQGSSGSSAGPGSATAAGLVAFAIGSETLGSIVSPSVVNGVTGLRPTFGRVPRTGSMTLCWSMDKLGPMCRGVEDCALVLAAIFGPDGGDRSVPPIPFCWDPTRALREIRVGFDRAAFSAVEQDTRRGPAYLAVLETLRQLGLRLAPVSLPPPDPAYSALPGLTIGVESAAAFQQLCDSGQLDLLAGQGEGGWPNTLRVGATIPAADYLQGLRVRRRLMEAMAAALRAVDVYVAIPFAGPSLAYTNLTGHPSLITRCGMLEGLPLSVEFIGGLYQEASLLRVALAYEQATAWHRQWPDTDKIPPLPTGVGEG